MDSLNLEGTPLVLDAKIRDWVLIPIFIIVTLIGILRTRVQTLITGTKKADKEVLELQNLMQRSGRLRQNGHLIPWDAFSMRKQFLVGEKKRGLRQKVDPSIGNPAASGNPMAMLEPMKGQVVYMGSNMFMMMLTSYFFAGFVVTKVPFPLTPRFKLMLQRGVDIEDLEPTYVSSLAWYFLLMFGLRGLYQLLLDDSSAGDQTEMMMSMQAGMMMGGMGQQPQQINWKDVFKKERVNVELTDHWHACDDAERRLVGLPALGPGRDFGATSSSSSSASSSSSSSSSLSSSSASSSKKKAIKQEKRKGNKAVTRRRK